MPAHAYPHLLLFCTKYTTWTHSKGRLCGDLIDAVDIKQGTRVAPSYKTVYVQHNAVSSLLTFPVRAARHTHLSYTGREQQCTKFGATAAITSPSADLSHGHNF